MVEDGDRVTGSNGDLVTAVTRRANWPSFEGKMNPSRETKNASSHQKHCISEAFNDLGVNDIVRPAIAEDTVTRFARPMEGQVSCDTANDLQERLTLDPDNGRKTEAIEMANLLTYSPDQVVVSGLNRILAPIRQRQQRP